VKQINGHEKKSTETAGPFSQVGKPGLEDHSTEEVYRWH